MSKEKSTRVSRTRNYATVIYPESAPENWQDILAEQFIPAFISPFHDSDVNPDGTVKKPHYHVMLMFDGVKTREQVQVVFDSIGGVGCEVIQSIRGYARYLCHLDNPEKHQYDIGMVRSLSGADYPSVISLAIDKYKAITEMSDFCVAQNIDCFADLFEYCKDNRQDWYRVLCDNGAYIMKEYLKSRYWKKNK